MIDNVQLGHFLLGHLYTTLLYGFQRRTVDILLNGFNFFLISRDNVNVATHCMLNLNCIQAILTTAWSLISTIRHAFFYYFLPKYPLNSYMNIAHDRCMSHIHKSSQCRSKWLQQMFFSQKQLAILKYCIV